MLNRNQLKNLSALYVPCVLLIAVGCQNPSQSRGTSLLVSEASDHIEWQHIADLDPLEWGESAMTASRGVLLFGETVTTQSQVHYVRAYDAKKRQIVNSYVIPHRAHYFASIKNGDFIVSGKSFSSQWTQQISTFQGAAQRFLVRTDSSWGEQLFEQFVEWNGSLYASEPGRGSIIKLSGNQPSQIVSGLSNPGPIIISGEGLAWLDIGSGAPGDENILTLDPNNRRISSKWPIGRGLGQGFNALASLNEQGIIAVSEWSANRVLLLNAKTLDTITELPTAAKPEGLTVVGNCVVVAATDGRQIHIFDAIAPSTIPVLTIDYSSHGSRLRSVRSLVSDSSIPGITIYLRSVHPWSGGLRKTESSIFRVDVEEPNVLETCSRGSKI